MPLYLAPYLTQPPLSRWQCAMRIKESLKPLQFLIFGYVPFAPNFTTLPSE